MADNVQANAGSGGAIFKTDEVGGVHTPITKIAFGVDGTITTVDGSNPLPVVSSGEVSLSAETLSALETVSVSNFPVTQHVSGSVSVSNFPASQPVTGTFWQATQPVSGTVTANTGLSQPLTDTQLRASAVPVSTGGITDAQLRATPVPVSGSVTTGGLTDAQLRATAVPVSGTVTANTGLTQPLTDTQLRAADVKVSLDGETVAINNFPATQPISAAALPLPNGASTSSKQDMIISAIGSPMQAGGSIGNTQFGATQSGPWTVGINNFLDIQPISAASLPLPTGASTEATSISSDQLIDELVFILQSMLEKMPRVTGNDQAAVSVEAGSLSTVTTVTTCGTVTTVSQLGTRAAMTAADAQIMQGTSHIYNNLVVS